MQTATGEKIKYLAADPEGILVQRGRETVVIPTQELEGSQFVLRTFRFNPWGCAVGTAAGLPAGYFLAKWLAPKLADALTPDEGPDTGSCLGDIVATIVIALIVAVVVGLAMTGLMLGITVFLALALSGIFGARGVMNVKARAARLRELLVTGG